MFEQIEKENLVPVNTRPAANPLLDNYSRQHSAYVVGSKVNVQPGRIPRIGNLSIILMSVYCQNRYKTFGIFCLCFLFYKSS